MKALENKIDFVVLVSVVNANPNGDPLNGNRPRTTYTGNGEISDVCIKRKLRNRLQDMGEQIFVQSDERRDDGFGSLSERASQTITSYASKDEYAAQACAQWFDVRAFGQVFAYKKGKDKDGVSVGVRGPVSIHQAISVSPVDINSMQITKSVNSEPTDDGKKSSDTMGAKHMVEFGLYKIKGAINVQLAEKTGFTEEDAETIKQCLRTLFINDSSAARPDGSMEVIRLYWWKHNNKIGQYS
ncbi:type I-C CRISPR-associated protein Cas7/Csd2, partial [Hydrogenoanaerobacterium sp.]|uniref:type I-C CRISPR-associated protein Cas7/Csd2 n=1 Tax=Hydrogenoanaerobacterium sp. TaxID=2953763 RepID=UPI00289FCC22